MRHVRKGGHFVALVGQAMADAGLTVTDAPEAGDIGIVSTSLGATLAIRTETGWAGKSERGITVAPYPLLIAWKV